MRGLVDAFCAKGYALRGGVRDLGPGSGGQGTESREVDVKLEGPRAAVGARGSWSARGVVPINEYLGMAATGFCRASGVRSSYRASYTDARGGADVHAGAAAVASSGVESPPNPSALRRRVLVCVVLNVFVERNIYLMMVIFVRGATDAFLAASPTSSSLDSTSTRLDSLTSRRPPS